MGLMVLGVLRLRHVVGSQKQGWCCGKVLGTCIRPGTSSIRSSGSFFAIQRGEGRSPSISSLGQRGTRTDFSG